MKDSEKLGKLIKKLRLENDLSLRGLGEKSGVSYSFINSIENNRYNPSRETVISLANSLYGADKNDLLLLAGFSPTDDLQDSESKVPDWATPKDKRDLRKFLETPEVLHFDGVELSDEDRAKMLGVMETIFWDAKQKNKEAYRKSREKRKDT